MSQPYIKELLELAVGSPMQMETDTGKEESDVEVLLLQQTFKNTRLSDLLCDRSHRFTKEDCKVLVQQINILKQIITQRDKEIQKLKLAKTQSLLFKEIEFLNNNNHNLFRTMRGLQKQIRILNKEVNERTERENKLIKEIEFLNVEVAESNKLIRRLFKNQKRVLKSEEEEVMKINEIRYKFQKENRMLRSQIKSIEKSQVDHSHTSRSKQSLSYSDLQLSTQCADSKDILFMKKEINKLKHKVKHMGRLKENTSYQQSGYQK